MQCAQLCLNDGGCLSFDAGNPADFQAGDCFLSYDNRLTNYNYSLMTVSQLDYYERLNGGLLFQSFFMILIILLIRLLVILLVFLGVYLFDRSAYAVDRLHSDTRRFHCSAFQRWSI